VGRDELLAVLPATGTEAALAAVRRVLQGLREALLPVRAAPEPLITIGAATARLRV